MEFIYYVNLTDGSIKKEPYDIQQQKDYGRGLAARLLRENTPIGSGRLDPDNAIVFAPGLFAGCAAPSSGRMTVLAKGDTDRMQVFNPGGDLPQKLGSLDICAIVITGKSPEGNAVLHIDEKSASLLSMPETKGASTEEILSTITTRFGRKTAVLGTGIAGDHLMSLSTVFSTYPEGDPSFNCPRHGFGDILGSKGLRAVAITGDRYFDRECSDAENLRIAGKALSREILDNPFSGRILPAYGAEALVWLMQGKPIPEIPKESPQKRKTPAHQRINYNCSPMCVIGCLNRHGAYTGAHSSAPDQSELKAALISSLGIDDEGFLEELQDRLRALSLVLPEFVTAARSYIVATGQEPSRQAILSLTDEIRANSAIGRLVGSRAAGIARAYPENPELAKLNDRPALADEPLFSVKIHKSHRFVETDDMQLLYYRIFVMENLGMCLFAAFGIINNEKALSLMAELYTAKTGISATADDLTEYAKECIEREMQYEKDCGSIDPQIGIPPFTKMLYRYFAE